jgi:hypothetical protein
MRFGAMTVGPMRQGVRGLRVSYHRKPMSLYHCPQRRSPMRVTSSRGGSLVRELDDPHALLQWEMKHRCESFPVCHRELRPFCFCRPLGMVSKKHSTATSADAIPSRDVGIARPQINPIRSLYAKTQTRTLNRCALGKCLKCTPLEGTLREA